MIRIITTAIALTLATPALAQENIIPGVSLGQTEAEAQAVSKGAGAKSEVVGRGRSSSSGVAITSPSATAG